MTRKYALALGAILAVASAKAAILVDINADGTTRTATTAHFETAAGLSAGTLSAESVIAFDNNNPMSGMFTQIVGGITVGVSDISSDADGWFGAGGDNNLLDDGLYHRDSPTAPTALITLSGLGLLPSRLYDFYLFAGRSQGHLTEFTFDVNDPENPAAGATIDVDPPILTGDETLGTALFSFETGLTAPASLGIRWDGGAHSNGNQDAVFSGFLLRDLGAAPAPVPEPGTWLMLIGMILPLAAWRRRQRQHRK